MNALTKNERDDLLREIDALWQRQRSEDLSSDELQALGQQRKGLAARYYGQLPRVAIGRCPFTLAAGRKRMDVFGLDGPWWDVDAPDVPAEGGPHLLTYQGALRFHDGPPANAAPRNTSEIQPGPEVPYVIPRLLHLPGVCCVVSSSKLLDQDTAYFIAYYAEQPIPPDQGHQEWLRTSFWFTDAAGKQRWSAANDAWDFDLETWKSRLWWIAPGDESLTLRPGTAANFPYANLPGLRAPRSIRQGKVFPKALPNGTPIEPGD